jgi:hypothetical protein
MPIPDYRIKNFTTFQEVTEEPHQIAGLYFYKILDCLVDLAYKISPDFRKRPQLYIETWGIPKLPRLSLS